MTVRALLRFLLCMLAALGGVPSLAAPPAPPPLSVYGQLPSLEMAAMSPSGDRVAMVGQIGEARRLVALDAEGKAIFAMPLGDAKIRSIHWAGEDMVLIRKSDTVDLGVDFTAAKTDLVSTIVVTLSTKKSFAVFEGDRSIAGGTRGFYGLLEKAGKWFGYFGGVTLETGDKSLTPYLKSTQPALYEVDLQTGRAKKIADRMPLDDDSRSWKVGADGSVQAVMDLQTRTGRWTIRNAANDKIAEGVDPLGQVYLVGLGAQSNSIIYSVEDPAQARAEHWYEVPLTGGAAQEILADVDPLEPYFDRRSRAFLGYRPEGDVPVYRFFNAYQNKVAAAMQRAFPGLSVHIKDWNDGFNRLLVLTEGPGDPQTWWVVDIKTGKAKDLGASYAVPAEAVGPMKMVQYKAGDGMDISAVLTLPPGRDPKNLPVLILPHGGPRDRDYPGFDYLAQASASRGYAVLQPNFRGSTGYGAAFLAVGKGEWGRKMQTDISDGLAYLVSQGIADPKRACIMGWSYGGYAALAGVTLQKGLYRCAVSMAGISDVAKMVSTERRESGDNSIMIRILREEIGKGRDLRAVSPINFAGQVDVPILLIHGKDDTVVLYDQSNDMAAALRGAGKPVEMVTLPGGDHGLLRSDTRLAMLQAAIAFVMKNNPPN